MESTILCRATAPVHSAVNVRLPAGSESQVRFQGLRLLVVEDYEHSAEILARLLRRAGHYVAVAHDVASAKALLEECPFDLLVSDIGLPDGTGWELMKHARNRYGMAGVALSGYGTEEDIEASAVAGFSEHMVKPVEWRRLSATILRLAPDRSSHSTD